MTKRVTKKVAKRKVARRAKKKVSFRKKAARRTGGAGPTRKRKTAKKKAVPPGYAKRSSGLLVPGNQVPVAPAKIKSGLSRARKEIDGLIKALSDMTDGYSVSEIELAASFSADGKFLGIGVGGATTITIRFTPEGGQ